MKKFDYSCYPKQTLQDLCIAKDYDISKLENSVFSMEKANLEQKRRIEYLEHLLNVKNNGSDTAKLNETDRAYNLGYNDCKIEILGKLKNIIENELK